MLSLSPEGSDLSLKTPFLASKIRLTWAPLVVAFQNMPNTRAKSRSRAPARAGAAAETAESAGPVEDSMISADSQVDSEGDKDRETMSD